MRDNLDINILEALKEALKNGTITIEQVPSGYREEIEKQDVKENR